MRPGGIIKLNTGFLVHSPQEFIFLRVKKKIRKAFGIETLWELRFFGGVRLDIIFFFGGRGIIFLLLGEF